MRPNYSLSTLGAVITDYDPRLATDLLAKLWSDGTFTH